MESVNVDVHVWICCNHLFDFRFKLNFLVYAARVMVVNGLVQTTYVPVPVQLGERPTMRLLITALINSLAPAATEW